MEARIAKYMFLFGLLSLVGTNIRAQDTAQYRNKAWRDSVTEYEGRLEAYHQELYSYDWGMTLGMLPVVGEGIYLGKWRTGIEFSAARAIAVAIAAVGTVRLIGAKPSIGVDIGMLVGGMAGYIGLKLWELADVRHTVSERNEELVQRFQIDTADVVPHSIRYPTKPWPNWITSWPPARAPQESREAVNAPLPHLGATGPQ